ncbi:class D sortase [Paenibacillus gorillae]|uniref:class D sortase n=1 Tax=Paenibacillus gorillae TaxID=1243662 RepID=UPI0005A92E23|nr:class D sortase [Paenibacillus gorillae]
MRKLSYLLIIVGILVLAYPKGSEWYANWQQDRLMEQWEQQSLDETAEDSVIDRYAQLTDLFNEANTETNPEPAASEAPKQEEPELETIGTISIPSIKVKLPILEGATQHNMKYGAAHLKETAAIGEVGNAAIAAHRAKTKGRLFNRLNEVKVGDKITITQQNKTFTYKVYQTSVVNPTDVSVLNYNNKDKLLTLITCTPLGKSTHRLIIHAKLQE